MRHSLRTTSVTKRTQQEEGVSRSSRDIHPQNLLPAAAASADEDAKMSHDSLQRGIAGITVEGSEKEVGMRKKNRCSRPDAAAPVQTESETVRQVRGSVVICPLAAPPRFLSKSSSRVGVLNIVILAC